jgi:16S rRNA (guanine527-N7)-methyltransferase
MGGNVNFQTMMEQGTASLKLKVDKSTTNNLHSYFQELQRWSKKINLIAKGSDSATIIEKHFLDSLTILPFLTKSGTHLLDVGTGAGFPGLVCGAARPDLMITLVEPRLKRVSFLRHIVRILKLKNIKIIAGRVEEIEREGSVENYTHITSRAVSDIHTFLEMIDPFLLPATKVLCMKGVKWQEETKGLERYLQCHQLELKEKKIFSLPFSQATRAILMYSKVDFL